MPRVVTTFGQKSNRAQDTSHQFLYRQTGLALTAYWSTAASQALLPGDFPKRVERSLVNVGSDKARSFGQVVTTLPRFCFVHFCFV